ncbi:Hsp20/alpha crystallin family protein [Streptomyces sp. A7024]|uniref:Hsp20/alpha crystallin family protein n=1 Tax=Streptomyces coryli TaxID=1128680 RepID=A0A6G4TRL0_9ACTN|nr:Hsp20/alpha crystallin family protein [Streptomyces coryli]NGN62484.1 Hsp20/alpha crystallin family protein [Streptomyces coryli]
MNAMPARRHGWPMPLPELIDWLESGFPAIPGMRPAPGIHGIRIEDELTDGAYVISAELPGIDPAKDLEISVEGDLLIIRAERAETTEGKHHTEFRYGTFARSLRLPAGAAGDEATADYKAGVLTITVPVPEKKTETRTIKVSTE